jgi:hypothetical protein
MPNRTYKILCRSCGREIDGTWYPDDPLRDSPVVTYQLCDRCRPGTVSTGPSRSTSSVGGRGDGSGVGGALGKLIGFGLLALGAYWIYAVVFPWIIENKWWIAFGLLLLSLFGGLKRTHGVGTALLTTLVIGAFGVGGVWTYRWYVKEFTGDYEVARGPTELRALPSALSDACGTPASEGQNLDCADDPCQLRDSIDGRWVRVRSNTAACWAPYGAIRFQHGMFFSLVNRIYTLRSTGDDDRAAVITQIANLRRTVSTMHRNGQWEALARLGNGTITSGSTVPQSIASMLHEGMSRERYRETVAELRRARVEQRNSLVAFAMALPFPRAKTELTALPSEWQAAACQDVATELRATPDAREATRLLTAFASTCPHDQLSSLVEVALGRVADPSAMRPLARRSALRLIKDDTGLANASPAIRARIEAAWQAADAEVRTLAAEVLSDARRQPPESVIAAVLERGEGDNATVIPPRDARRLRQGLVQNVQRDARRFVEARRNQDDATLASLDALSAQCASQSGALVPAPGEAGWRVDAIEVPEAWALRATVTYGRQGHGQSLARWTVPYQYSTYARRWFACGAPTEVGR